VSTEDLPPAVGFVWPSSARRRPAELGVELARLLALAALVWIGIAAAAFDPGLGVAFAAIVGFPVVLGVRLVRELAAERRTGWRRLTRILGRRRCRSLRTFTCDGLIVVELGWEVTLPGPRDDVELATLDPFLRWAVLQVDDRAEEALALAGAAYLPDERW
jgi:hypothetical protein